MQVQTNKQPIQKPTRPESRKIGSQDYPANPALDEWAQGAEITTVPQFFKMCVAKNPDGKYVGKKIGKEYQYSTYKEVGQQAQNFSSALIGLGIQPTDRVAVFAENSPEWRMADFGIASTGAVLTCLLPEYPDQRCEFVLQDSGSKAVMVDSKERLEQVIRVEGNLPELKNIIVSGDVDLSAYQSTKNIVSFKDFMAQGEATLAQNQAEIAKRESEICYNDIGSIVYTSGSTGNPKGVLLSHGNVIASVEGMLRTINDNPEETLQSARREDLYPSILPLGHVMGRVADYAMTAEGGTIAYPGSLANFAKDLRHLEPTVLAVTPLFLHKIYDGVENKAVTKTDPAFPPFVASLAAGAAGAALGGTAGALIGAGIGGAALPWGLGIAGAVIGGAIADKVAGEKSRNLSKADLFSGSLENSKKYYEAHGNHSVGNRVKHELSKKFVFAPVKEQVDQRMGGKVRIMISGGAPLSGEAETLMRASGYGIAQGYGLAETSAGALMNNPARAELGTGGAALPGDKVRLEEGTNEIQISGPNIMTGGYLNRDDKTKEAFTPDGWYRTGDKGQLVKTTGPVSKGKLAALTGAGALLGGIAGSFIGHPALGAALAGVAAGTATIFTGAARTEGKDHYVISGRIKSQFKLPGGEYVTPEPIEAALQGSPFIARSLVTGGKERDLVGALIQPNFEVLGKWAAERKLPTDPKELVKHPDVIALYDKEASERSQGFQKHEVVRRTALLDHELSGDEVTNKGEVMRSIVSERYADQIKNMFA
ncbi:AMP-binding protein [bacterium]|nr:AMP-binding protein [bacterium]